MEKDAAMSRRGEGFNRQKGAAQPAARESAMLQSMEVQEFGRRMEQLSLEPQLFWNEEREGGAAQGPEEIDRVMDDIDGIISQLNIRENAHIPAVQYISQQRAEADLSRVPTKKKRVDDYLRKHGGEPELELDPGHNQTQLEQDLHQSKRHLEQLPEHDLFAHSCKNIDSMLTEFNQNLQLQQLRQLQRPLE